MKKGILTALAAFTALALSAQGYYMEMKLTSDGQQFSGTMQLYFQDNNSRGDIVMNIPALGGTMNISTISLGAVPGVAYMLDDKKKTYTEIKSDSDESWKDYPQSDYEVTVLGKESVNGYNTTHVRIARKGSKSIEEMWTTTEIIDYADYAKIKSKYTGKDNLYKALEAKGAAGFPVRIKTVEQGMNVQIDLVKAEKRTNPATLFSLSGYKKAEAVTAMPAGLNVQELMKNMQNMTPEQLEQMQKQLEQQYKPR